jgi:hypothetical protein
MGYFGQSKSRVTASCHVQPLPGSALNDACGDSITNPLVLYLFCSTSSGSFRPGLCGLVVLPAAVSTAGCPVASTD